MASPILVPSPNGNAVRRGRKLRVKPKGNYLSPRVKACIDLMVWQARTRNQAAANIGLSEHYIRVAFQMPKVVEYYNQQLNDLRLGYRAKAVHNIMELAEDKAEPGAVRLKANTYLDSGSDGSGVPHVQVNVGVVMPGYVVQLQHSPEQVGKVLEHAGSVRQITVEHTKPGTVVPKTED